MRQKFQPEVVIGLSGGVDSAVAAWLLQEQGYQVTGVTMLLYDSAQTRQDLARAGEIASRLGIAHQVLDGRTRFEQHVLRPCWQELERGATPNPCVRCNALLKFVLLAEHAAETGAARVATGHYARIGIQENRVAGLYRALDAERDQSYFLYALSSTLLQQALLPLGSMTKTEVYALAATQGLVFSRAAESQDLCFAEAGSHFAETLRQRFQGHVKPGILQDETGRVLGQHQGIHLFTIGQRHGLGVAAGRPLRVKAIHAQSSVVVVSDQPEALDADVCHATGFHWQQAQPRVGQSVLAQIRYRQPAAPAVITAVEAHGQRVTVKFAQPVRSVTPGQALVLYERDLVLGGGCITLASG